MKNLKKIAILGASAGLAALVACGSDSVSAPAENNGSANNGGNTQVDTSTPVSYKVESPLDMPTCDASALNAILDVAGSNLQCTALGWAPITISQNVASISAATCNSQAVGQVVYSAEDKSLYTCSAEIKGWAKTGEVKFISKPAALQPEAPSSSSANNGWDTPASSSSISVDQCALFPSLCAVSSSSIPSVTPSSSSIIPSTTKEVTFADGIMWQPSYGERVRTFFGDVTEYDFLSNESDMSGFWYTFADSEVELNGLSTASFTVGSAAVTASFKLSTTGWHYHDPYEMDYMEPNLYPYAALGFNLHPKGDDYTVKLNNLSEGLCVTYTASDYVSIKLVSTATLTDGVHYVYRLSPTTSKKTVNIAFSSFKQPSWITTSQKVVISSALAATSAIQFSYSNDEAALSKSYPTSSNTVAIYKLGKYGMCN